MILLFYSIIQVLNYHLNRIGKMKESYYYGL